MSWTLQIDEQHVEQVTDANRLRQRLMELHQELQSAPAFALLHSPDGSCLAVGLGRQVSVLSYTASGGWPAKHVVNEAAGEELVDYQYLGHFSQMPARYAVPVHAAVDAAIEFFNSGRLTEELLWEDD